MPIPHNHIKQKKDLEIYVLSSLSHHHHVEHASNFRMGYFQGDISVMIGIPLIRTWQSWEICILITGTRMFEKSRYIYRNGV